jgi:hypothetical protein
MSNARKPDNTPPAARQGTSLFFEAAGTCFFQAAARR